MVTSFSQQGTLKEPKEVPKEEGGTALDENLSVFVFPHKQANFRDGSDTSRINPGRKRIRQPEQRSLCQKDPPSGSLSLRQPENASLVSEWVAGGFTPPKR